MLPYLTLTIPQTWDLAAAVEPAGHHELSSTKKHDGDEEDRGIAYRDVNRMLHARATGPHADCMAVGFAEPRPVSSKEGARSKELRTRTLTYAELWTAAGRVAEQLGEALPPASEAATTEGKTAAPAGCTPTPVATLLCPSGYDFLTHLTALWRLGYAVLPLDPANQPLAAVNLMRLTGSQHLFFHGSCAERVQAIDRAGTEARGTEEGIDWTWKFEQHGMIATEQLDSTPDQDALDASQLRDSVQSSSPLVIMHTSGSTGLPKPIYQLHRFWTRSLTLTERQSGRPLVQGTQLAAFTTTPLFHGGMSDFLRSVQAGSAIFFANATDLGAGGSITAPSLVNAVEACGRALQQRNRAASTSREPLDRIGYFLSVPYILEVLASEQVGIDMLSTMELVSTGGAPLPQHIGDHLVENGVPLVSRMGSSECGCEWKHRCLSHRVESVG